MEQQFTKRTYTTSQKSLLTRSMLIAGIAFIILGAASYGWSILFRNTLDYATNAGIGFAIFFTMLIGGMVVSILWCKNMMESQSMGLTILCYGLYILLESLAFGWIFSIANVDMWWLPVIFLVTGGTFLLSILIARLISINSVMSMGKIIGATSIAMLVMLIIFMVLVIVTATTRSVGVALAADTICSLIMMGMAIVSFFYIIIDIWQISKMSEFAIDDGQQINKILPWFFGYRLLTDLVNVLFIVLMFVIRFAKRG